MIAIAWLRKVMAVVMAVLAHVLLFARNSAAWKRCVDIAARVLAPIVRIPRPLNWMVIAACVVHGVWGLQLLAGPSPLFTTPMASLRHVPRVLASGLCLFASGCAALAMFSKLALPVPGHKNIRGLFLCLPQQFLMMSGCAIAAQAVWLGAYPDGYSPTAHGDPHQFIFADQLWPIVGMLCHTFSLWDFFAHSSGAMEAQSVCQRK